MNTESKLKINNGMIFCKRSSIYADTNQRSCYCGYNLMKRISSESIKLESATDNISLSIDSLLLA